MIRLNKKKIFAHFPPLMGLISGSVVFNEGTAEKVQSKKRFFLLEWRENRFFIVGQANRLMYISRRFGIHLFM